VIISNQFTFEELHRIRGVTLNCEFVLTQKGFPINAGEQVRYHFPPDEVKVISIEPWLDNDPTRLPKGTFGTVRLKTENVLIEVPNNMTFASASYSNQLELKSALLRIPSQKKSVEIGKGRIRQFLSTKEKKELILEWDFEKTDLVKRGRLEQTEDGIYEDKEVPEVAQALCSSREEEIVVLSLNCEEEAPDFEVSSPSSEAETPKVVQGSNSGWETENSEEEEKGEVCQCSGPPSSSDSESNDESFPTVMTQALPVMLPQQQVMKNQ
jgi:hypothetical protein